MSATETTTYKGRPYRLVWSGPTKYGVRAKLAYLDGSKEFWVDAAALGSGDPDAPARAAPVPARVRQGRAIECWECGFQGRSERDATERAYVCPRCGETA